MKISIVIASRNMGAKVEQCLSSIFNSDADRNDYEVVVCDSSDDNTMDELKKWVEKEKSLKVIHVHRKVAPGPARNIAVEKCSGDYLMFLDIDDKLHDEHVLKKVIGAIGDKDIYALSYFSRRDNREFIIKPSNFFQLAQTPVAPWAKVYRKSLYVPFPSYTPEDVVPHFLLIDKCQSFGFFDFAVVDYDNTPENKGAWSRTFDYLYANPSNLLKMYNDDTLEKNGLNDDYISGVLHNLGDMWRTRKRLKNPEVKKAFDRRFAREWQNMMCGIYVH